ncbi:FAD binding domain-containing protein [Mycena rosella]|uniref:FAD binding domain-containing protein n=1 Tax=Mycena rosella TaxID=1033263 RepID=A0AAD7DSC6_MYCRO|nr:FAD binding domain-containing protein [Mycena rosella]
MLFLSVHYVKSSAIQRLFSTGLNKVRSPLRMVRRIMDTSSDPKILIVGAGPSGLLLALTLCRNGIPVRIIDKLPSPSIGQRGPGVMPRTQEIFRALGVLDGINEHAIVAPQIRTYIAPDGVVPHQTFHMMPPVDRTPACPHPDLILVGQNDVEGILRAALREYSCEVEYGTELVSLAQDADGVDATITTQDVRQETRRFTFLVGADGGRSAVRKQLGLAFLGESRPSLKYVIADIMVEGIDGDHWHAWGKAPADNLYLRPAKVPGLFGLFMLLSEVDNDFEAVMKDRHSLEKTIANITGRKDLKVLEVLWITKWTPNIRIVDKFSAGRCFVAGDAAHAQSPTGGQGTNSGIQDSFNLAWKLALVLRGQAPMALLDTYHEERSPVIQTMLIKTTELLNAYVDVKDSDSASNWDRDTSMFMLGINYRWSALVVDEQDGEKDVPMDPYGVHTRGLRAGDRAPDAPELEDLVHGGPPTRFFDVLDVSRHTVLVFSASPERYSAVLETLSRFPQGTARCVAIVPSGASAADIHGPDIILEDTQKHAYSGYGFKMGCDIVVVRPDGVLGAVVRSSAGLEQYFRQIFVST